ncbi:tetratricopeptide repeat protein [uncultured Duncaniella sp.]|uniref:tetratricopeptide repeat protein n=1 Tax=uncultured Duncaniella sp. TaxID=2768039 RepID=UPI00273326E7|nr:tetratricopeptide repeat protein [uncultured Duncaniella sp.]
MIRAYKKSGIAAGWMRIVMAALLLAACPAPAAAQSVRQERRDINAGNSFYKDGKYAEAIMKYKEALNANGQSDVAKFNLGLSQIRMSERGGAKTEKDSVSQKLYNQGVALMTQVAEIGAAKADLSSKANYNLGNLRFDQEDYAGAISFYKQALRLNPGYVNARRNLRIAQLRQQEQQDKNDQNQDRNKDQDKDKDKDQDKDQNQQDQQNQDQQNQQDRKDKQDQQQQAENELSRQAAEQILNAVENNEAQTRAKQGTGEKKSTAAGQPLRQW